MFLIKIVDKIEELFIVALLVFMTVMNFANVASRYLFSNSFSFTEEIIIIGFVWISMLGISAGYKKHAHLGMNYITEKMPIGKKKIFSVIATLCSLAFVGMLFIYGIEMVQGQIRMGARTPALNLPTYIQGLAIPIGTGFMIFRIIEAGIRDIIKLDKIQKEGEI